MSNKSLIVLCLTVSSLLASGVEATDDWIKEMVVASGQFIHGGEPARAMFRNAKALCRGDTNRFARILCELAQTNNVRIADRMIRRLGIDGTAAQLPFLYSMATNEQYGASAVKSILRLEGVTSNSVDVTGAYLSMTNIIQRDRSDVCSFFFNFVKTSNVSAALKERGECAALRYARTANLYFRRMDEAMISTEPAYRLSKRRLDVLRSAYELGVSAYQLAYVTNAINELVAYPEENLPE